MTHKVSHKRDTKYRSFCVNLIFKECGNSNLRHSERHLPYGITQFYLPPDTGKRAPP